jgi:hypothetical protein
MANPTLNTNVTYTLAAGSQYIPELWTREVERPFTQALVAANLVQRRDDLAAGGGDIVNVPFMSQVNARSKAASTAVTYDSPEAAAVSISINKHYYSAVLIEDIAKVQASYDLRSMFQEAQAEAVARQIDTDVLGLFASAGTTVAGGAAVDDADIIAVVAALDASYTPQSERFGVIGAGAKGDLLNVNKYVAYDQTGKTGKAVDGSTGLVASLYNMDIYMSQNVPVSTTGREQFFHKKALTLVQQLKPTYLMEYSVDQIGWKTVLNAIYGVAVERAASFVQVTRTTAA